MAILKDLIVNGATRLIGDAFANKITISTLADSAGNIGTDGLVLRSDGENIVWSTDNKANITTTTNSVAYYSDTTGTFASDADFLWDATNNKLTAAKLNGYVMAGLKSGTTLGSKATAEGFDTVASGVYSHAEGYYTSASGNFSHAEGNYTAASGDGAHAEGYGDNLITWMPVLASGQGSHAEGYVTTASGDWSHAEGYLTTALRKSLHVFGEFNILDTTGNSKSVRGSYIEIVGNGTSSSARSNARTLDWSGNESLAGNLLPMVTNSKTLGDSNHTWADAYITTIHGALSGNALTATKFASSQSITLTGDTTGTASSQAGWSIATTTKLITGTQEAAEALTTSPGTGKIRYSYNVSNATTGLFPHTNNANSILTLNKHTGNYDAQLGFSNNGNIYYRNFNATALDNTTAWKQIAYTDSDISGNANTATKANITTTANSVAYYSDATGTFASDADFLWDSTNNKLTATNLNGYVMAGLKAGTTLGTKSTAEGNNTTSSGGYSHAEGSSTTASGMYSHAEGSGTTASGNASHAENSGTTASGMYSHAEGCSTTASGYYSHAEGLSTTASGDLSHAEGYYTTAQRRSLHVFGEFNILDTTGSTSTRGSYIEIVGNGANAGSRSNARTLDWSGNESLAGNLLPMVTNTKTLGTNSLRWKEVQTRTVNSLITGTGAAAKDNGSGNNRYMPAKWTFNTGANATNGDVYTIKVPCAGHSYGVFMSVNNGTNYYPVVCGNDLTSRLIAQYPNGQMIQVIFDSNGSAASMYPLAGGTARVTVSGGVFRVINYYDTDNNTLTSAQCGTAAGTAAKVADCTYWTAKNKSYIHVNFRYANSSQSAITLNINSTGRKAIWINGAASSASNYTLPAGSYLAYYLNDKFYFRTDGFLPSLGFIDSTKTSYGEILPETGTEGQIFFLLSDGYTYELPAGGAVDEMLIKNSATDRDVKWTRDYVKRTGDTMTGPLTMLNRATTTAPSAATDRDWITLTPYFHTGGPWIIRNTDDSSASYLKIIYGNNTTFNMKHDGTLQLVKAYGAVWNDYAEFRETKEDIEPGRCIRELGDDTLELTTERLMRGCEIISDTFGFAIGQSEKAKTPTAASGRVLAYLYEDRELAKEKIGWPVCSGPNGTVSIMTEEEEEKYPSRIIGTISAVPDYEIWYGGNNGDTPILVNGRIWIRIR